MIHGTGNLPGLAEMTNVRIIGGLNNPAREGLVSLYVDGIEARDVVARLNEAGIRTHLRKADHYSGNILHPLGWEDCVRVSVCHYNSSEEIKSLLLALNEFQMDFPTN